MRRKLLNAITAALVIITMTMANFVLFTANIVSYAAEVITAKEDTSHRNITFTANLKNGSEESPEIKAKMDSQDLLLQIRITVKQEGYFNGNITLKNSNFKLKNDILSEGINKIEDNTIYLAQINAGESREILVGIHILKSDKYNLKMLDQESTLTLTGIYRDSTEKNINITGNRVVKLQLISPYDKQNKGIMLENEIITNSVLSYEGKNRRIIQLHVTSGMSGNLFPVKSTAIQIASPKLNDKYPEKVFVASKGNLVTNGKELTSEDWEYDKETGNISIHISNDETNGEITWNKTGADELIITYLFEESDNIKDQNIESSSQIQLYDVNQTKASFKRTTSIPTQETASFVTVEVSNVQNSIDKGKLYYGIDKEITENIVLHLNFAQNLNAIQIREDLSNFKLDNVYNRRTTFSKENIVNLLGENGTITITNLETGETITTIDKTTQADTDGNIIIDYPDNVRTIQIDISATENKFGQLKISNTKVIKNNSIDTIKNTNTIEYKLVGNYVLLGDDQTDSNFESNVATIELKETETSAKLEVNKKDLSTMSTNKNVEIRAILQTREEKNELYKNPKLKIILPEKVQKIELNTVDLIYEDELEIAKAEVLSDGRTIEITLNGEQTKYKEEAIEGATVIINANITVDKKAGNSKEQIAFVYTNEKAIHYVENKAQGEFINPINIVSYAGVITTTTIPEKQIEIINNDGSKKAKLEIGTNQKEITFNHEIMNNKEGTISDVRVLGTLPTKGATTDNNIDTQISQIMATGIEANKVRIYYTDNEKATESLEDASNMWKEEFNTTAKKYLVVIEQMQVQEIVNISYKMIVPANLEYNAVAKEGYHISYIDDVTTVKQNTSLDFISLESGAGPVVESSLMVTNGGKEVKEAREGEILTYKVTATNTGSEEVSSVSLKGRIPEGTVYVEELEITDEMTSEERETGYKEYVDVKEKTFTIPRLLPGQSITEEYEVRIQKGASTKSTITNEVELKYGEVTKKSNSVDTEVKVGDIQLSFINVDQVNDIQSGSVYRYVARIKNISNTDIENASLKINLEGAKLQEIMYFTSEEEVKTSRTNTIEIDKLAKDQEINVGIYIEVEPFNDEETKYMKISGTVTANNVEYHTNEKNINVKSSKITIANYSQNSGGYVKAGDEITYKITVTNAGENEVNDMIISDRIHKGLSIISIKKDEKELTQTEYSVENSIEDDNKYIKISDTMEAQETREYHITLVVNKDIGNEEAVELNNLAELYVGTIKLAQASVNHILQPEDKTGSTNPTDPTNPTNPNKPSNPNDPNTPSTDVETRIISGIAWFDQNENGQKDEGEELLQGVGVRLLNTQTNEFVKDSKGNTMATTTNNNGFYTLSNVPQGSYMVIFEYDTSKYILTTYQKEGIDKQYTSKAVDKNITIDGEEKLVGGTEVINIANENIANINIGLKQAKIFDLRLDKYVSKVIVQNSRGTSTFDFGESTIAKAEIDSKLINSTSIVVEYKIKITNEGEVDAYVKKIADYISSDYKFSSELNKDWYQSDGKLYNTSLANTKLQSGQSQEVTLTVTKQMTENNTGLIPNTAEIVECYNEQGLFDVDSTPGNNVNSEDDLGSAELIISIKTGQVVATVMIILVSIIVIGAGAFLATKMILRRKII